MRKLACLALLAACGCGHSYDKYRTRDVVYVRDDGEEVPRTTTDRVRSRSVQVIYSSDVQGGYGPGSYGSHGGTVITPQDDGTVIIEGEYHRR
ncbi:MAG: hypothetical protein IT452_08170 [Planctomycetia bacterium]|nr:hypothetical protein [Planctomycetia bacterium]